MKRTILCLLIGFAVVPTAAVARSEWWWYVIEWIMQDGGTWRVW